jgi:hypothetical protein
MSINSVVPTPPSCAAAASSSRSIRSVSSWTLTQINAMRSRIKISKLGKYSAKRVEDLDNYCQHTSLLRVVLVIFLMPWPALILELVAEWIPLQDPASGWRANYGAYLRIFIAISSAAGAALFQIRATTPALTYTKLVAIAVGCGSCTVSVMVVVALLWVFPIPFGFFIFGPAATASFVMLFLFLLRNPSDRADSVERESLKLKVYLIFAQVALAAIYMLFNVAFTKSTPRQRIALVLFLPVMKISLKHLLARLVADNPESIPAVVVFTIDVFHGLYTSICMQSSGSWWTSLLMIAVNVIYTVLSAMDINKAAKSFQALDRKTHSISRRHHHAWNTECSSAHSRNRSSSLVLSAKLQMLSNPTDCEVSIFKSSRRLSSSTASITAMKAKMSACLLFQMEYRALVGYTEAVMPLLYAVYLSILVHLPSAKYYPHSQSLTPDQLRTTIGSIAMYAATEMLSMVWLHVMVKRKLGFSLFYQLAYILETEMEQLQGRLFVWILILLQLPLEHFGTFSAGEGGRLCRW